jgi:hypothetical protein
LNERFVNGECHHKHRDLEQEAIYCHRMNVLRKQVRNLTESGLDPLAHQLLVVSEPIIITMLRVLLAIDAKLYSFSLL